MDVIRSICCPHHIWNHYLVLLLKHCTWSLPIATPSPDSCCFVICLLFRSCLLTDAASIIWWQSIIFTFPAHTYLFLLLYTMLLFFTALVSSRSFYFSTKLYEIVLHCRCLINSSVEKSFTLISESAFKVLTYPFNCFHLNLLCLCCFVSIWANSFQDSLILGINLFYHSSVGCCFIYFEDALVY